MRNRPRRRVVQGAVVLRALRVERELEHGEHDELLVGVASGRDGVVERSVGARVPVVAHDDRHPDELLMFLQFGAFSNAIE